MLLFEKDNTLRHDTYSVCCVKQLRSHYTRALKMITTTRV